MKNIPVIQQKARQFIRHPIEIPLEIIKLPDHLTLDNYSKNISTGGIAFKTNQYFVPDDLLQIKIDTLNPIFESYAKVSWCLSTNDPLVFDVGVEFLNEDSTFQARMIQQVCQITLYKNLIRNAKGINLTDEEAAKEWVQKFAADFPQL